MPRAGGDLAATVQGGRGLPSSRTATHCPYCSLQCAMEIVQERDGRLAVEASAFPTNRGTMCQKGWTSAELLRRPDRLTTPLLRDRRDAELRPASWDEALDRVAGELRACAGRHGRDAVGVFGGGGLTNEKAYQLGKFARVALRTSAIDYNGRFCMSSAATASMRAFGVDRGMPFPLEDLAHTGAILLVGSNLVETMPPAMAFFDDQRANGGKLVVIDPRATDTARRAHLHLQPVPGTDLALANALLHIAIKDGFVDDDFVQRRTAGFPFVAQRVGAYWPDRIERITGVPADDMRRTVRLLAEAPAAMILTGRGPEQQSKGTDTVQAFINLALALGHAGRPLSGYGCLTGQGNGQGGREHGQKADQLPGYRRIDDPQARRHVARVWGIDADELPGVGRSAWEMLDAMGRDGGIRALLVMGSNVVVSAPASAHVERRLAELDFLVVGDLFMSETACLADVVLPTTQWAEEDGTMTNFEGRVLRRRAALTPPPGARSDLEILEGIAQRLGCGERFPSSPRVVFDELRRASAGGRADYAGITWERIADEDGVFWPCPDEHHPGTPRLFLDAFATPNGRARFHPVSHRACGEEPDDEFPLYLTTGRILAHYQSGTQTRRVRQLCEAAPEAFVELHPVLARRMQIEERDLVSLRTRRGTASARARLTPDIRADTLFMPFHWGGEGRANLLTNPALDPDSKMPEFKVCAVRIESVQRARRGGAS
ncbi:MAG: assimilatory nitrate reductase catalytic subunit [Solirubrobacteraceae bacterium]|nr:assimilatory nitrate reductase catalytic subunit [Solirubrobacteraceae bacterium]MEA2240891.1 assimilatory nitrate reductase catalytic subunit [Solirubrobacteraceae bacterium]